MYLEVQLRAAKRLMEETREAAKRARRAQGIATVSDVMEEQREWDAQVRKNLGDRWCDREMRHRHEIIKGEWNP